MKRAQANRAVIAARSNSRVTRVNMPAHLSAPTCPVVTGPVRKSRALPMTGAQRDSTGARSDWSRGASLPYSVSAITGDAKWSVTVGQHG